MTKREERNSKRVMKKLSSQHRKHRTGTSMNHEELSTTLNPSSTTIAYRTDFYIGPSSIVSTSADVRVICTGVLV